MEFRLAEPGPRVVVTKGEGVRVPPFPSLVGVAGLVTLAQKASLWVGVRVAVGRAGVAVEFPPPPTFPEVAVAAAPSPLLLERVGDWVDVDRLDTDTAGPAEPEEEMLGVGVPTPTPPPTPPPPPAPPNLGEGVDTSVGRVGVGEMDSRGVREAVVHTEKERLEVRVDRPVGKVRVGVKLGLRVGLRVVLTLRVPLRHPELVMV